MSRYYNADTRSITAVTGSTGSSRYGQPSRYIDAREYSNLRSERLSSFEQRQEPFYMREESVRSSQRRMASQMSDFDTMFAAAGNRR